MALIVILSAALGAVVITQEPDTTDVIYSVEGSGNADNEIHVTRSGISYMYTDNYYFITNDRKSHAHRDMTIYRPVAPEGWYIVGDYCQPSYDNPTKSGILVRAGNLYDMPILAPPKDWELVWADYGSGATRDTSIWKAIPPSSNYIAIGYVAVQGYNKPVIPEYRCVLRYGDTIEYAPTYKAWSTDGSPAKTRVTIYAIDRYGMWSGIDTNTFAAYCPEFPTALGIPCLKS